MEKFNDRLMYEMSRNEDKSPKGIDEFVLPMAFIMFVIIIFFLPFIYIGNNIYLTSLEIERNKIALMILQDENQQLKRDLQVNSFALENR